MCTKYTYTLFYKDPINTCRKLTEMHQFKNTTKSKTRRKLIY